MSDSVQPHRQQPTRLPHHWDSPGKNTGVGCHFLLQCIKVKSESEVTQLCPTLSDPMDCSPPGSSIHGIFQARVLEWGAIAFSIHCPYLDPIVPAYQEIWSSGGKTIHQHRTFHITKSTVQVIKQKAWNFMKLSSSQMCGVCVRGWGVDWRLGWGRGKLPYFLQAYKTQMLVALANLKCF